MNSNLARTGVNWMQVQSADLQDDGSAGPAISPALVWQSVRQWWYFSIPLGLMLATAAVVIVWMVIRPTYEAAAWLRIDSGQSPMVVAGLRQDSQGGGDRFVRTQVELIRSPAVLQRVVERPEIASMPEIREMEDKAKDLRGELKIASENESDLFSVRFESPNRNNAAAIVNAVVEEFVRLQDDDTAARFNRIVVLLEKEVSRRDQEVTRLREEVQKLANDADPTTEPATPEFNDSRAMIQKWLDDVSRSVVEREVLQATLTATQETLNGMEQVAIPDDVVAIEVEKAPEVQEIKRLMAAVEVQIRQMQAVTRSGQTNPALQRLQTQLQQFEESLEQAKRTATERIVPTLQAKASREQRDQVVAQVAKLRAEIRMHETLESLLGEKIEAAKQKLIDSLATNSPQQKRAQKAMELASKQAELQMAEQVRQMIKERADLFTTEQQAPSGVTILTTAQPPMRPKHPFQQMAAAGLGAFVIPALLALFWEYRVQRVVMAQQLSRAAALPILSEVPNLPLKPRLATTWSGRAFSRQLGLFEDSIHYLCRSLMLSREADGIRTVAVTSAISGEGKTSVALQLARSLALCSHEPVLLVDGDLRKAGLHDLLNLPAGPGLADLLAKQSADRRDLETTIISQRFAPIHVLAAGNVKRHPHFILQQDKLEAVFKSLGQMYRYIVVDTPPVLGVGEALSVCKAADGTLVCAMRDVSRQSQVEAACQKLFSANARPIGFVLNGVPSEKYASRYGSDYHARQYIEASGSNGHSRG